MNSVTPKASKNSYPDKGFYFHGTDEESAAKITRFGFDERFSRGIYGDESRGRVAV